MADQRFRAAWGGPCPLQRALKMEQMTYFACLGANLQTIGQLLVRV